MNHGYFRGFPFIRTSFFLICFSFSKLIGLEYGLYAKRDNNTQVKRLHIFSERCSGSFYTDRLIKGNFKLRSSGYGHKHFPPWFELPLEEFKGKPRCYTFEKSDEVLFVVVFRNPYDWIKSLHQTPHHAASHLCRLPFSRFIREQWQLKENSSIVQSQRQLNPYVDYNPKTKKPFKNVLKLRTAKIRNMLLIKDRVKNIYYINYEKIRDYPKEVVQEIADIFGLTPHPEFQPVIYYKGDQKQGIYKQKKFYPISYDDLIFINKNLSPELEKSIGYRLIYNPWEQFFSKREIELEESVY